VGELNQAGSCSASISMIEEINPTCCGTCEVAIGCSHRGHTKGSVSQTFRIKWDQFLLTSLEQRSGSSTVGIGSSASRFRSLPRVEFA